MERRLAKPGAVSPRLADRYSQTVFQATVSYDDLDRVTSQTTGADVPELLGNNGRSAITTTYSGRGTIQSVQGDYGTLVSQFSLEVDGLPHQVTFGDVAGTTTTYGYDNRRRLQRATISRNATALWSLPMGKYTPPQGTKPSTLQLILADEVFDLDAVGNPRTITDRRISEEWPPGAKPVTRQIQYDDLYRTTQVDYDYGGASTDQFDVPTSTEPAILPIPWIIAPRRVQSQKAFYDGLGDIIGTQDDEDIFFDRCLGVVTNGSNHPNQFVHAEDPESKFGGKADGLYDASGNLIELKVLRLGACEGQMCSMLFRYEWDEVGQLSRARRWDFASTSLGPWQFVFPAKPSSPPSAELVYSYDAGGQRVLQGSMRPDGKAKYSAEVFSTLSLNRAEWSDSTASYEKSSQTESIFLASAGMSFGRVVNAANSPSVSGGSLHVFLELGDRLGSTSAGPQQGHLGRAERVILIGRSPEPQSREGTRQPAVDEQLQGAAQITPVDLQSLIGCQGRYGDPAARPDPSRAPRVSGPPRLSRRCRRPSGLVTTGCRRSQDWPTLGRVRCSYTPTPLRAGIPGGEQVTRRSGGDGGRSGGFLGGFG